MSEQRYYNYFIALETTLAVQNAIHTARYAYRRLEKDHSQRPLGMNSQSNLYEGIGLCGTAVEALIAVLNELRIKSRRVHMFYLDAYGTRQGHNALEALIGGKWVFLEPTWGLVFQSTSVDPRTLDLMSWHELRQSRGAFRTISNGLNAWRAMADLFGEPFDYAKLEAVESTVGEIGQLTVPMESTRDRLVASFYGIHNFIGDGTTDQQSAGIRMTLPLPQGSMYAVTVKVAATACAEGSIQLNGSPMVATGNNTFTADIDGSAVLSVKSPADVCYFVLSEIIAEPWSY